MKTLKKVSGLALLSILLLCISISLSFSSCIPLQGTGQTQETAETSETTQGSQTTTAAPTSALAGWGTWIWLIILVAAFYFLLIRPQRQRTKKQQDLLSTLKKGDEIVTIGGFYGRIKDVREDFLIVTISNGVDVKILKSAVSKKIGSE